MRYLSECFCGCDFSIPAKQMKLKRSKSSIALSSTPASETVVHNSDVRIRTSASLSASNIAIVSTYSLTADSRPPPPLQKVQPQGTTENHSSAARYDFNTKNFVVWVPVLLFAISFLCFNNTFIVTMCV